MPTGREPNRAPLVPRDDFKDLPPRMFVLVRPGEHAVGIPEVWRTERNDLVAAAYSSLDLLVDAYGSGQPWIELSRHQLRTVSDRLGITLVALDGVLPDVPSYPEQDVREEPDLEPVDAEMAEGALLYVPSRPARDGDRAVALELQHYRGKLALLAYTAPELVQEHCGPHQAWVAIPAERLDAVIAQSGADLRLP